MAIMVGLESGEMRRGKQSGKLQAEVLYSCHDPQPAGSGVGTPLPSEISVLLPWVPSRSYVFDNDFSMQEVWIHPPSRSCQAKRSLRPYQRHGYWVINTG